MGPLSLGPRPATTRVSYSPGALFKAGAGCFNLASQFRFYSSCEVVVHATESQRAVIAARLANMKHGGDRKSVQAANRPLEISQPDAAKMFNVSERTIRHAQSYALRAERKMGEMLKDTERQKPGQYKQSLNGNQSEPFEIPPTLAELGLSKRESSRAQLIADLPEDAFEEIENGNITAHEAIKKVNVSGLNERWGRC